MSPMLALIGILAFIMLYGLSHGLFQKGRRAFGWLIAVVAFGTSLVVSNKMEHDARAAGFQSSSDQYAATEAGFKDPKAWKLVRDFQGLVLRSQTMTKPIVPNKADAAAVTDRNSL
ncbi:hypothetical protein [Rhizobium sp. BR 362]|uniref:hypothetical protein n=1 Tax=Rhizobium sp. BR 362 TaxID=3040670 RepID=UPI002F3F1EBD